MRRAASHSETLTRHERCSYGNDPRSVARDLPIRVVVLVRVDRDGSVAEICVLHSIPGLDENAVDAVRQSRFEPATLNGQPLATRVPVPVKFTLH